MSLIVGRKFGNDIFLIADSKLTDPLKNTESLTTSFDDYALKIVILNSQLTFAFAGGVDEANECLKIARNCYDLEKLKQIILHSHKNSYRDGKYNVEYLLAIGYPYFDLIQFKNGEMASTLSAWVGSYKAFSIFQDYYLNEERFKEEKTNTNPIMENSISSSGVVLNFGVFSAHFVPENDLGENEDYTNFFIKAKAAMKSLIESRRTNDVGGFFIPVMYHKSSFQYNHYAENFFPQQFISEETGGIVSGGTPEGGAYSVAFITPIEIKNFIGFHFLHGNFSIEYEIDKDFFPNPIIHKNFDVFDYSFYLKEKFSLKNLPGMCYGFNCSNFSKHIKKLLLNNDYEKALGRVNEGLSHFNQNEIGYNELFYLRSRIYLHQNLIKSQIYDLSESIPKCSNKFYVHILNERGKAFCKIQKYQNAIIDFSEAIILDNSSAENYFNRAIAYLNYGFFKNANFFLLKAIKDFKKSEELGYDKNKIDALLKKLPHHLIHLTQLTSTQI